jgi:hypothetical protein
MFFGYLGLTRIVERKRKHDELPDPRAEIKRRKSDKGGVPPPTTAREVIDLTVDLSILCVLFLVDQGFGLQIVAGPFPP